MNNAIFIIVIPENECKLFTAHSTNKNFINVI